MRKIDWKPAILLGLVALAAVSAQQAPAPDQPQPSAKSDITVTTIEVQVPVTVHDRDENIVNGLQPRNFRLYDNGKEQNISVDATYQPLSMVIAIQNSASVEEILPQVKKIGSMLETMVVGDQGEAAVITFDGTIRVRQDFTNEVVKISEALNKILPGATSSRLVDAYTQGVRMLSNRPKNRRKVLLMIGETRDYGSEGRLRDAILATQFANVTVYTVNMSRMISTLTKKPLPPRGDPLPPATRSMPSNVPATPTSVFQKGTMSGTHADFVPLFIELLRDVKAVFKDNPAEALTKASGGEEFGFVRQRGLEDALARIGEEIHSQYIITYNPNNKEEAGFHEIKVEITPNRGEYKARYRPGYWLAAVY
jgi:VWFA-related protein